MTISRIILTSLFIHIANIENLYEPKLQLSLLKEVAKFLKNPKNNPIVPLLWLNDNEIICNVGLGCERESLDRGRSYIDKNINISNCFFSRYPVLIYQFYNRGILVFEEIELVFRN